MIDDRTKLRRAAIDVLLTAERLKDRPGSVAVQLVLEQSAVQLAKMVEGYTFQTCESTFRLSK